MADRTGKRGRGEELNKGKGKVDKRNPDDRDEWWIHVQLGSQLRALHEEEISDHRKVMKKMRTLFDLISYELRHWAEVVRLIRQEGIEEDDVLVREFLKYQLNKHMSGSTSTDPHGARPSSMQGATPSGSDGEAADHPKTNDELEESDDEIIFEVARAKAHKKRA